MFPSKIIKEAAVGSIVRLFFMGIVIIFISCIPLASSDDTLKEDGNLMETAPKVFIDGHGVDSDYLRTEIPFVNYVRDRKDADIHLQIFSQQTGSGGREYILEFNGQKRYLNKNDTLKYVSLQADTYEKRRIGLVKIIKMGLMRYLALTSLAEDINITFTRHVDPVAVQDKWNNWVFRVGISGSVSGEKSYKNNNIAGSLRASRVTPEIKINLSAYANFRNSDYKIDGETYENDQASKSFNGMLVKSMGGHWSLGGAFDINSSTYSNNKSTYRLAAAIEYNIFPYSEATKKQLAFNYSVGYRYVNYREETIYDKMEEGLFNHNLFVVYEQRTKWGSFFASLSGSQYLYDLSKSRFRFRSYVDVNLFKGFSFYINGRYSLIHDQLSIVKGDITPEEILLRQKQLATTYDYRISIGLSYSFGSIYNNVVNPRFDHW